MVALPVDLNAKNQGERMQEEFYQAKRLAGMAEKDIPALWERFIHCMIAGGNYGSDKPGKH